MADNCYLCGKQILGENCSADHVVPKQFIRRPQPKVKGFDYAGHLPSHKRCNNQFGPEQYCQKALILIKALHDENCFLKRQHAHYPNIQIMALNSECFPGFTDRDLQFFKITDVRKQDINDWSNPSFFADKPKTNPMKRAFFTALAVLSKSAAALLVSRCLPGVPSRWRILAIPYFGHENTVDFDELLGDTKPFDVGLKVWIRPMELGDWFAIYKVRDLLVYLLFWFSSDYNQLQQVTRIFGDAERLMFDSEQLIHLVGYEWEKV